MTGPPIDLGDGHIARFVAWGPDRDLNPQYAGRPDIDPCGIIIDHRTPDGGECSGYVAFDLPGMAELFPGKPVWQVASIDPLTLSPSILCKGCGEHGYITSGAWVRA
jgi:hypothetical protein